MAIEMVMLRRFEGLIRARAGLAMRQQEAPALLKTLEARMQFLHYSHPATYLDFLASDSLEAQSEWKRLWVLLTNQESYFFRDFNQLNVIGSHILPELIRHNRQHRTLRVWSAGCSTGEEPYSLAMLFDEIPELREWQVSILGTDISEAALERAQGGLYGPWSFRSLDKRRQERFFRQRGKEWEVTPHLRQKVTFASNNLFGDTFPTRQSGIHDMDLIVCRNVFIYFGRDAVSDVLRKFSATLRPRGFLICGHAELHDVPLGEFKARPLPQSVIYQRETELQHKNNFPSRQNLPKPEKSTSELSKAQANEKATLNSIVGRAALTPPNSTHHKHSNTSQSIESAVMPIRQGHYASALEILEPLLQTEPNNLKALCLMAQAQANSGRLDEAETTCARVLSLSAFEVLPYHLKARIAEERGQSEIAKALLKKVLYLQPNSVWATLELGDIYEREGDTTRAIQVRRAALELLHDLSDDASVPVTEHAIETPMSVGELKRQLQIGLNSSPD